MASPIVSPKHKGRIETDRCLIELVEFVYARRDTLTRWECRGCGAAWRVFPEKCFAIHTDLKNSCYVCGGRCKSRRYQPVMCMPCANKHSWIPRPGGRDRLTAADYLCMDCGKQRRMKHKDGRPRRCMACENKRRWREGVYG